MSVLKLDDLIKDEIILELNSKKYHYNLSFKAMVAFKKWSEVNDLSQDITDANSIYELIKIIIIDAESFIQDLEKLSVPNQTRILTSIISNWINEMVPPQEGNSKEKK